MSATIENIVVSRKILRVITADVKKTAKVAGLIYIMNGEPGLSRIRDDSGFIYLDGKKRIQDTPQLERIKKLVIPPAWENVWICKLENGHIQATGIDKKGRKQYRYHPLWMQIRSQTKFSRLKEFGEKLPAIRNNIEKDLKLQGFPMNKVMAAMVSLLERINIRVGNSFYEKLYGSFGLTTLKNHHVKIIGSQLQLMFKGKKGVYHRISLSSRRLARIVQGCKEIPGKELFEYYDEQNNIRVVDSGMINNYIKDISGSEFTAKDFRTWAGTVQSIIAFKEVGQFNSATEMNKKIPEALDIVARQLGNTRAVCKKYYVHPIIIDLYQGRKLDNYLEDLNTLEKEYDTDGYVAEERILLKILNSTFR